MTSHDTRSTLPDLLRAAADRWPSAIALRNGSASVSYVELRDSAYALAAFLRESGMREGDRVCIALDKSIESISAFWAVALAGGVFVPINPRASHEQVLHIVNHCRASAIVGPDPMLASVSDIPGIIRLETASIARIGSAKPKTGFETHPITADDVATIVFTSGSTGRPKGVVHSHYNLVRWTRIVASYLENSERDVLLGLLPLNGTYGLSQLLTATYAGATLVLQKSGLPVHVCRTLQDLKVTGFAGVPTTWAHMLQRYSPMRGLSFPHLRYITNAGGHLPAAHLEQLRHTLGNTRIYLMYGQTETLRSSYLPYDLVDQRPGSMGRAMPEVELFVLDENGKPCPPGRDGVLVHRGACTFLGYWDAPDATSKVLKPLPSSLTSTPGELAVWTGDVVKQDEDGFLYFVGRNDDMIKTAGYRVGPQEIEDVLYRIPHIKEVVAFGVPDEILGHRIKAVATLVEGSEQVSAASLVEACRKELPDYMAPTEIQIVEELPRTTTGKPQRGLIAQRYGSPTQ